MNKKKLNIGDKVYKFEDFENGIKEYMVNSVEVCNYIGVCNEQTVGTIF